MAEIQQSKSDVWIGCGILALCGVAAWQTLNIKQGFSTSIAGPSFLPWLMIAAITVLSLIMILRGLKSLRADGPGKMVQLPQKHTMISMIAFIALLVVYAIAFYHIGYIPATLATFITGLWLIGERKIWILFGFPIVMTFAVHFAFTEFLSVWLP